MESRRQTYSLAMVRMRSWRTSSKRCSSTMHRRIVLEQRLEDVRQDLIRTIANEYVCRRDSMAQGNGLPQPFADWIGIEPQRIADFGTQRLQYPRTGAVGIFVGIELDQVG